MTSVAFIHSLHLCGELDVCKQNVCVIAHSVF